MNRLDIVFAPDHPAAAGHFPGNPIMPGAVLLCDIAAAIVAAYPGEVCRQVVSAKFLHPVWPGETITVSWERSGDVRFRAYRSDVGTDVITGALRLGPL